MPRKTTELRSFLGLTNCFREQVPKRTNVVAPLHTMIYHAKKQSLLIWTDAAANSFQKIKDLIAQSPLLYFIHDIVPITLMTDAPDYGTGGYLLFFIHDAVPITLKIDLSDYGIGGYLYREVDGEKQVVALVSKSLTKTQLKWSVISSLNLCRCTATRSYIRYPDRPRKSYAPGKGITRWLEDGVWP